MIKKRIKGNFRVTLIEVQCKCQKETLEMTKGIIKGKTKSKTRKNTH